MREKPVEQRLKERLEEYGFKVLKLETPGHSGTMDRWILRPKWSPGAPWVCECKRPKKTEERHQELVAEDFKGRGVLVLARCDSYERVEQIVLHCLLVCADDVGYANLPPHANTYIRGRMNI